MKPALELHDVAVRFRATTLRHRTLKQALVGVFDRKPSPPFVALDGVSLSVDSGQMVGVLGRNGAGKSTLIRVLARIIIPNQGRVVTRGRVVPLLELGVGFHPQMTGRENCYLVGSLLGLSPAQVRERLPGIAAFAELQEFLDTPIKHYSSGMYARLAFSLVCEVEPEVLLVDEILAVGDEFFQRKSQARLQRLMGQGATTVIVSHNVDYLAGQCNRLIWLDQGKIIEDGPCAEVVRAYRKHMGHTAGASGEPPGRP